MDKEQEIIIKYVTLFKKLIKNNDKEEQLIVAKDIADFSSQINDEIEKNYSDSLLHEIQEACLSMEHWKDGTGYCNLTEKDIKKFLNRLEKYN